MVDVLVLNLAGDLLAAGETSGVWLLPASGSAAVPLSRGWANPHVQVLAFGSGRGHMFAGCTGEGIAATDELLYETVRSAASPTVPWAASVTAPWQPIRLPAGIRAVHDIAVVSVGRVVLATDWGLWWSAIPDPGGDYRWAEAVGASGAAFFSVCAGGESGIIAGLMSPHVPGGRYPLMTGHWLQEDVADEPDLRLVRGTIPAAVEAALGRTSVDACPVDGYRTAYAVGAQPAGTPAAVLQSTDGGASWTPRDGVIDGVPADLKPPTGTDTLFNGYLTGDDSAGGRIHRVTVCPTDPLLVGFGQLREFLSTDGGTRWRKIGPWHHEPDAPMLHTDVHVVAFSKTSPVRMVIATDGGVVSTPDFGNSLVHHNEQLPTLQICSTDGYRKGFYGRFARSWQYPGLTAAGLQDNGNVYTNLADPTDPWHRLDPGDGGACHFPGPMGVIRANENSASAWQAVWDPATSTFAPTTAPPVRDAAGKVTAGFLYRPQIESVLEPTFSDTHGQLMYAIGWRDNEVYGLFARSDGSDTHWQMVARLLLGFGDVISAAASWDGTSILALLTGDSGLHAVRIKPSLSDLPSGPGDGGFFVPTLGDLTVGGSLPGDDRPDDSAHAGNTEVCTLIRAANPVTFYALYRSSSSLTTARGAVYRTEDEGDTWTRCGHGAVVDSPAGSPAIVGVLPDDVMYGLAVAGVGTDDPALFVCTDRTVYRSLDWGLTWRHAAQGLPRHANGAHLEATGSPQGGYDVWLGTYGWGLWQARA